MARIYYTSRAEEDLLEIWSYIADDSLDAAHKLVEQISAKCEMLLVNPAGGRTREEFGSGISSFGVGNYLIFYRPTDEGILIVRVLHGARDLPELF